MDGPAATRDDRAIRDQINSWYRGMEEGDLAGLLSLVTTDVIVKAPGSAMIVGRNSLEKALRDFLRAHCETVDYEIEEVETCGRLAFARILESATILDSSGATAALIKGMHLTILRRQPDGEWLIARDISSRISSS